MEQGPSTEVATEYLMTIVIPLDAAIPVDGSTILVPVRSGGSVSGPRISGTIATPSADWLRVLPSGALRMDVRLLIHTDDNAYVYLSYNGVSQHSKESAARLSRGEVLTDKDVPYFITAPTFQTSSETYAWLNSVQAVGKMAELKRGVDGYVKYDVFVVK